MTFNLTLIVGCWIYTVCDKDVVVTEVKTFTEQKKVGTFAGRAPLLLVGPEPNKHNKYIICTTRDGKGIVVASNELPFKVIATKAVSVDLSINQSKHGKFIEIPYKRMIYFQQDAHSMAINAICAVDDFLFTAGSDGKVKKWKNFGKAPTLVEEIDTGKCINVLCAGPDGTVFAGDAAGFVKRLLFSVA